VGADWGAGIVGGLAMCSPGGWTVSGMGCHMLIPPWMTILRQCPEAAVPVSAAASGGLLPGEVVIMKEGYQPFGHF
jgi:hypothetical protein